MGLVWLAQGKPKGGKMLAASLGLQLLEGFILGIIVNIIHAAH